MATVFVVGARGIPDVEGGAEKNAERLFPRVVETGHRVVLCGLADQIHSTEFRGVELVRAPRSKILKTDKLFYYITAVLRAAKLQPDIVHLQGLGSALFLFAYRLMGMKTVVRYGSADYLVGKWGLLGRWGFLLAEYQLRFADAVIAVTPALAERLQQRGITGNIHVIPNAVDEPVEGESETPLPKLPYVLSVGRVTAQKNVANLIRGFSRLQDPVDPDLTLVVAGSLVEADYVASLQSLLSTRTQLMGLQVRSAMGRLYANAAVYINASIHEGSSNAVLEAMSYGAPTLLSDIPENRDFGLPDKHYFDPLDPDAIASAIQRALGRPEEYRVPTDRFLTWSDVAARTIGIYTQILAPKLQTASLAEDAR